MVGYTVEEVLELIMANAEDMVIHLGTEITIILETTFVPLVVPDEDGHWVLKEWEKHAGAWKIDYAWQRDEYHLLVRAPDDSVTVIKDSQHDVYEEIRERANKLNAVVGKPWPFMVEKCE